MRKLTPKQQRFVDEYLVDLNGTQAAIRAGYSEKTAKVIASQSLTKANVAAAVHAAQCARAKRTQVDADWVLDRLETEAKADLADIYNEAGALKPVKEWPLIWRQGLIAGVETAQEFEEVDGKKVSIGLVHKVKISDRIKRVELIGKHLKVGAFVEKHEHTGPGGGPIQTEDVTPLEAGRRIAFALALGMQTKEETVQ
jgi:phage terminase small subunit